MVNSCDRQWFIQQYLKNFFDGNLLVIMLLQLLFNCLLHIFGGFHNSVNWGNGRESDTVVIEFDSVGNACSPCGRYYCSLASVVVYCWAKMKYFCYIYFLQCSLCEFYANQTCVTWYTIGVILKWKATLIAS